MKDQTNPNLIFQTTDTALLIGAVTGDIDLLHQAAQELASRGLDHNGRWVGFAEAQRICRELTGENES